MDGSSRTRKPSLLQTSWVEDDGVCSAPQKRSADRYREKYRKASRDTLQVMLNWGEVLWNSVPLLTEDAMRYPIVIERGATILMLMAWLSLISPVASQLGIRWMKPM